MYLVKLARYLTWPHHRLTALLYFYMCACKCQLFTDKGSCRLPKRLNYCVYHYNTSLKFTQLQIRYFRCLTSDLITCSSPNTCTSLTPGTHVPQGYSSCVCVCVVRFPNSNESATKNYGSPQRCSRLINNSFLVVQPVCKDTEFEWQP